MIVRKRVSCAAVFGALVCLSVTCAAGGVYDDFESYEVGAGLLGKGIWSTWSAVAAEDGVVSTEQAATGTKSLKLDGVKDVTADVPQTSGVWEVRSKVFIPSDHTANAFFIMMNVFDRATQSYSWALQLTMGGTGVIHYDDTHTLPLVVGAWSEIRVVVDLDANKKSVYYNGAALIENVDWAPADTAVAMTVIDYYNEGTAVYWDDVSVAQFTPGIQTAGALLVNLDAADPSAGTAAWANAGALKDFVEVGNPTAATVSGAPAVNFNMTAVIDAYQQAEASAPATLTRTNPTMSVEAWVYSERALPEEQTIVAWGHRGGPDGTNMSFNYGTHATWGAVGHWGGSDMGWYSSGAAGAPPPGQWHHLVYTFDGTNQRAFADGAQTNSENIAGALNLWPLPKITLTQQLQSDAGTFETGLRGVISVGRMRVHDRALTAAQVAANYEAEYLDFPSAPKFLDAPTTDVAWTGSDLPYTRKITVVGVPTPTLAVLAPEGGTITEDGLFSYVLPEDVPALFAVRIEATNTAGAVVATWGVTVKDLPPEGELAIGGELFVDLSAADPSAGTPSWANNGTLGDFVEVGDPAVVEIAGASGVSFNTTATIDSYQQPEAAAPAGIVGLNATSTIEAWVYTESIPDEQTILAWGTRGPNDGNNMSFNYGTNAAYGAMGHWGWPDMGWSSAGGAPVAKQWHHMAYVFDGATQYAVADGELWNSEYLGAGVLNIVEASKITLACQLVQGGAIGDTGLRGVLALGKVRIHNEPLSYYQLRHNYLQERPSFPYLPPAFLNAPASDFVYPGSAYVRTLNVSAVGAAAIEVLAPAGATITQLSALQFRLEYALPVPEPDSFTVDLKLTDDYGSAAAAWEVAVVKPAAGVPAGPVHRYSFTEDANDSVGTAHGTPYGNVTFGGGSAALGNDGSQNSNGAGLFPDPLDPFKTPPGAYIDLPNGIVSALGNQATFEAWVAWNGPSGSYWQRIFDFGTSDQGENLSTGAANSYYVMMTPWGGASVLRTGYRQGPTANERVIDGPAFPIGSEQHVAVTWDGAAGSVRMFLNGVLVAQGVPHFALSDMPDVNNWLGRAQWGDPMLAASYNEFRIFDYAMTPGEVLTSFQAGFDFVKVLPAFVDAPESDSVNSDASPYLRELNVTATGEATVEVLSPEGATVEKLGARTFQIRYAWPEPAPSSFTVTVRVTDDAGSAEASWEVTIVSVGTMVYIGDANCSKALDIADAVCILGYLFGSAADPCKSPCCQAQMDTNNSDLVDIADAIRLLSYLFTNGDMLGPDASTIMPANAGCRLYPQSDVTLPCARACPDY